MTLLPPEPVHEPSDLTLRFAVGDPAVRRSSTWSIVGARRSPDVFIGARSNMGRTKVTLHRSGKWRLAFTKQSGLTAPGSDDRVLHRYVSPPELAPGFQHGATVIVPDSCLRAPFPEKTPKGGAGPISWWPTPGPGKALRFDLLLCAPDCSGDLTLNVAGEVGRMTLSEGSALWVVATDVPFSADDEQLMRRLRSDVLEHASRSAVELADVPFPAAMAWGFDNDDGVPVLYDLGDPSPFTT
jgi:hypothetical protein